MRVLIADDHAVLRAGLRLLVDAEPDLNVVAEAAEGAETVAEARRTRPDVVVLDLSMPGTDPAATIRQLSRLRVRVVVLTMHDDPAYVDAALAAGAKGFVMKKAADVELLAAIRAVSRGCQFLDATAARRHRARPAATQFLSAREEQVMLQVAHGFTNRETAARLGVSIKTVETFRARVYDKLGLRSRAELVAYALRLGLVAGGDAAPREPVHPPAGRRPLRS